MKRVMNTIRVTADPKIVSKPSTEGHADKVTSKLYRVGYSLL